MELMTSSTFKFEIVIAGWATNPQFTDFKVKGTNATVVV